MSPVSLQGSCLCGRVSYAASAHLGIFQYCHCSRCRKVTGSAHAANLLVPAQAFQWTKGEGHVTRYELPDARHFATSFCSHCGSNLPWLAKTGKAVIIPAGSLDQDPDIRPSQNIHCASRADWAVNAADLPSFDALPTRSNT